MTYLYCKFWVKKRDPVCGVKVSKNTEYFLEYRGKRYYFDCAACKATFQENPDSYLRKKINKGFLSWLAKDSESVPKSCHEIKK